MAPVRRRLAYPNRTAQVGEACSHLPACVACTRGVLVSDKVPNVRLEEHRGCGPRHDHGDERPPTQIKRDEYSQMSERSHGNRNETGVAMATGMGSRPFESWAARSLEVTERGAEGGQDRLRRFVAPDYRQPATGNRRRPQPH